MASTPSDPPVPGADADQESKPAPKLASLRDLAIIEAWDSEKNQAKYCTFYIVTPDEELFFGESKKNKRDITLDEFSSLMKHVPDHKIYPEIPKDTKLTIAPDIFNDNNAFIKRPGLNCYESMSDSDYIPRAVLEETVIMEQISKNPHPYIIKYHGCRVRRNRITCIVLELLDETLTQFARTPAFEKLDKTRFFEGVQSAVYYLHSLGLAPNDINPDNIMVKDGMPVLIDFGSCQPYGNRLQSLGTPGWYEELFYTSEKKHDIYSLGKLREWLEESQEG